jgi:isoquinoline 1-oxidoreductase beta subunit
LHLPLSGAGFGRRLEVDYVAQAVRVAMDCRGTAVQLIGSREEDTANDFFRPNAGNRLCASIAWSAQSIAARW